MHRLSFLALCSVLLLVGCGNETAVPEEILGNWAGDTPGNTEVSVYRGHEHCGTQDLLELQVHDPATGMRTYFLRDPGDDMRRYSNVAPAGRFETVEGLPPVAEETGFTRRDAALWLAPDAMAAYVVLEDTIERWPRWEWSLNHCD